MYTLEISCSVFDGAVAFLLGVEDPQGNTAYLKIFNHALLLEKEADDCEFIMPVGTVLAIREPTFLTNPTVTDLPFIRVDSPSDVVFVDSDSPILSDVSWGSWGSLPVPPPRAITGGEWKAQGLKDFKASQWFSAAICFTNCIKLGFDVQVCRLNRSEVYLRQGWNNSAFRDAQDAFKSGTLSDDLTRKAVVRMLKALYAMGRYRSVLETANAFPDDKVIVEWVARAGRRIEEQSTGNYDWLRLYKDSKKGPFSPDVADFTGPIEIKAGPNGVRGTFVSRNVKAGELLVSPRAPCFCIHTNS